MQSECCRESIADPMSVNEALEKLFAGVAPVATTETVALFDALGRVLSQDLVSGVDVPPADNSSMDGYAVRTADVSEQGEWLPVSQTVPAGQGSEPLRPGSAARIFTGAPVPAGCDAVVMQERCTRDGARVRIPGGLKAGLNIRRTGEDFDAGTVLLRAGHRLRPQDMAVAAAAGRAAVSVYTRVRVAVLATGDELVEPGQRLGPGQIHNSNVYALRAMLIRLGCDVVQCRVVADTLEATEHALRDAASAAHLVITTGGVSVGDEDHVRPAVERLGSLDLWRIAVQPGKPVAFGHIGQTPLLGLPGNPVSAFVTFCLFARPVVLRRQGVTDVLPATLSVDADFILPADQWRTRYLRAQLETETTRMVARLYPQQGSGVMRSTSWSDGLIEIPAGKAVTLGDKLRFLHYNALLN